VKRVKRIENLLGIMAFTGALMMIWFPDNFIVMLGRSFAFQIMIATLCLVAWLVIRKRWRLMPFPIVGLLFLQVIVGPSLAVPSQNNLAANGFRVAHFNVLKYNSEYDSTVQQALATDADLISFQEVDRAWAEAIEAELAVKYPYAHIEDREHTYGLAVFSKYPLQKVQTFELQGVPNIAGQIEWQGQKVNFVASHLKAPLSVSNFRKRNKHMIGLAEYVEALDGPTVVVGDFNTVPWDSQMQKFRRETSLMDSRKHLAPTYPSKGAFAAIPIDYIFHSHEFQCLGFDTLEPTNSDHLGIVGVYQLETEINQLTQL